MRTLFDSIQSQESSLSQLSAEELVIAGAQLVAYTVQLENIGLISWASYNLISLISIMQRFMSPVMDVLTLSVSAQGPSGRSGMSSVSNIFLIFARRSRK